MRSVCQWRRHCRKFVGKTDYQLTSSFQKLSKRMIRFCLGDEWRWNKRSWFVRTSYHTKLSNPTETKITKILESVEFPLFKKTLQSDIGFLSFNRNYIPRLAEQLNPFYQLFKATENQDNINITPELMNELSESNDVLEKCCHLALREPLPDKPLFLMADATFQAASYAVLTEDDPD